MGITNRCEKCGREINHGYESVHVTEPDGSDSRQLCLECYNREMAAYAGIDFVHPKFSPVELVDTKGDKHVFYIATRLLGNRVAVEAFEEEAEPGYCFKEIGDAEEVQKIYQKLLGKMRRALTRLHLVEEHGQLTVADDLEVRGRFAWDDETDGKLPLLVIDGKAVTWHDFGQILMAYEGWQFKLEIYDPSDEA